MSEPLDRTQFQIPASREVAPDVQPTEAELAFAAAIEAAVDTHTIDPEDTDPHRIETNTNLGAVSLNTQEVVATTPQEEYYDSTDYTKFGQVGRAVVEQLRNPELAA